MDFDSRFGHRITQCEHRIKHTFINKLLAAESLNNARPSTSVYFDNEELKTLSKNDRLAVYGDSIATTMLCRDWYHENTSKAAWTLIRNEALCNDFLAETGFSHGLDVCINKDAGTPSVSNKMMATAVEAILGAVHLDGGDAALHHVLTQLRIVNPYTLLVLFVTAAKWLFCRAAEPRDSFDLSGRGVFDYKARSCCILTQIQQGFTLLLEAPRPAPCKCIAELALPCKIELRGLYELGPPSVHGKTTSVN